MPKIYFIEDDRSIAYVIEKTLNNAKFEYQWFQDCKHLFEAIDASLPDLILLDLMLPNESGLDHLKRLRSNPKTESIPVIILSALSSELDKVTGLDLGADDYVTKPFGVLELLARIQNKLRHLKDNKTLSLGNIEMDLQRHEVTIDGTIINLTYKEFELLKLLLEKPDEVVNRDHIFQVVWGSDLILESRTIDMHIKSIRKKLAEAKSTIEILTVRAVGYRLVKL
ncbi:response regulator transcription factor [Acholeplasma vituli]|uniref:Response regulator transcription factor n=1 Tax=Paracholeplasma vituli TaxID=69473 RepID=A0ABT2PV92_9MOLU|nr:response regulator transcription factor [Paracholeplasma vituli]MCU0104750.1 response regulator transcription factor [Paracholeplasma vituli]